MDWHARFTQQAGWTRNLRQYLFAQCGLDSALRILEVGCGTGAVLAELETIAAVHGLDLDPARLAQAGAHVPGAHLLCADGHALPYPDLAFDLSFCHFLLLWVRDPLQVLREMRRVTRPGGAVLALAEPDYTQRVDQPHELAELGRWQTQALHKMGADPAIGAQLGELFVEAGLELVEFGSLAPEASDPLTPDEREMEWAVIEADLAGTVPGADLKRLKKIDQAAWADGTRVLYVPTHYAWGWA